MTLCEICDKEEVAQYVCRCDVTDEDGRLLCKGCAFDKGWEYKFGEDIHEAEKPW